MVNSAGFFPQNHIVFVSHIEDIRVSGPCIRNGHAKSADDAHPF